MTLNLSKHATARMRQRGILLSTVEVVIDHFDVDQDVGGHRRMLRTSREAARCAAEMLREPALAKQLANIVLIEDEYSGRIVTVIRDYGSKSGSHYRQAWN